MKSMSRPKKTGRPVSARRYYIQGRVQGVGFRYFVKQNADALGVRGYVRNEDDGSVLVYALGDADDGGAAAGVVPEVGCGCLQMTWLTMCPVRRESCSCRVGLGILSGIFWLWASDW